MSIIKAFVYLLFPQIFAVNGKSKGIWGYLIVLSPSLPNQYLASVRVVNIRSFRDLVFDLDSQFQHYRQRYCLREQMLKEYDKEYDLEGRDSMAVEGLRFFLSSGM